MKEGESIETRTGRFMTVWTTFSFGKLDPAVALELLKKFDFGKEVLLPPKPEGKAWRNEVILACTAKILTVEIIYQSSCAGELIDPALEGLCSMDAENSVFKPIAMVLEANDLEGNASPPATPPAPAPAQSGRQGGGSNP